MEVEVLGPLRVLRDDGTDVQLPSASQRRLLSVLALRAGTAVSADWLADQLGVSPGALRVSVCRLRRMLGEAVLATVAPGYALRTDRIDAIRFERLLAVAQRHSDPADARRILRAAATLWRGEAFAEFAHEDWARPAVVRLGELRATATENLIDATVATGDHAGAIALAVAIIGTHPLRERPRAQLMRALVASGRHVDALRAFQDYRRVLLDETGLEPSAELRLLERKVATHSMPELVAWAGRAKIAMPAPGPARARPAPYHARMTETGLDWIAEGRRFGVDDFVFFAEKGERELDDVLADIDLIVTGPHASAAFPAEMRPFVDTSLTRRLQYDFTDVSTSPVARRWAAADPHVLYIEDPHPRAVRDANRPRPTDLVAGIREAFERLAAAEPGARPSLAGVDAVRPVTFAYLPVLRRPETEDEWARLGVALTAAGALGIDVYERVRDDLMQRVIEAKLHRLASLDPASTSAVAWRSAHHLDVLSIHDTMNHTARPDGAIADERTPADRLPAVVALSNRGDAEGDVTPSEDAALRSPISVPTMEPARLRAIARAYRVAFDAWGPDDVAFNRPYLGGHETQTMGPALRAIEPLAVVRLPGSELRRLRLGAWQNEFLREFLLGEESTAHLMKPGGDWVGPPPERVGWLADRLRTAHDLVRRGDGSVAGS